MRAAYVLLAVLFMTLTSYVAGVAAFAFGVDASLEGVDASLDGAGGITSLSGEVLTPADLFAHTAATVGYLALWMLAIGATGLFFSAVTDPPLAAALGVLAAVVTSAALLPLDAASAIHFYLPTTHWLARIDLYREPIQRTAIREGIGVQLAWVAVISAPHGPTRKIRPEQVGAETRFPAPPDRVSAPNCGIRVHG